MMPIDKKIKVAILMAHGGVGDFLFQLDLAKRLEENGVPTIFLVRKNMRFLSDIVSKSNMARSGLWRADGVYYLLAILRVFVLAANKKVFVINPFHFTRLRFPTRVFYTIARFFSARVIVSQKTVERSLPYEQVPYMPNEPIWRRNIRITELVSNQVCPSVFPVLSFQYGEPFTKESYIHIHPVASSLVKSYPARKLEKLLSIVPADTPILVTITPKEESWYLNDGLRAFIASRKNITLVSRQFSLEEIAGFIRGARVFSTVNTGLLWLAIMLGQNVVVADTFTDTEWNPVLYPKVVRLCHEYDENGASLHLETRKHDDGTYFESMYRVEPEEIFRSFNK